MSITGSSPTVLIIGASRGLGLALAQEWLARGWTVIATVRGNVRTRLHAIAEASGSQLCIESLEITDFTAIDSLRSRLSRCHLDLLFINAGVANGPGDCVDEISVEEFSRVMVTNALSPMRIVSRFGDLVPSDGMIAVMSSGLGSVALNETGGWEVYRASKSALNMLMRSYAARYVNERNLALIDPGWVRTDMGGSMATLSVEESIPSLADAIDARRGQHGLVYIDYQGKSVPW
jgi:NAD(P)-dependent dehydrogenase (short-subunit alcohol dehydrogenase family)